MKYYLGIDGGGTKTKFTLCKESGLLAGESMQPTCHYLQKGLQGVTQVLHAGIEDLCRKSDIRRTDIVCGFCGIPGFGDIAEHVPSLLRAVSDALPGIPHRVGNDCENALAGALGGACGINLIAGTGSMGCGKNDAGAFFRCGGWHQALLSDEGSGYWIGIHLIHEFTRQSDMRDKKTPLYEVVRRALDLQDDGDVIQRVVEEWKLDRTKIASLSALIGELCAQEDPYAVVLLEKAADELCSIADALYRRLSFTSEMPVSYTGGVFQIGEPLLAPLRRKLEVHKMQLTAPLLPPECGALLLAMQMDGQTITQDILHNLA